MDQSLVSTPDAAAPAGVDLGGGLPSQQLPTTALGGEAMDGGFESLMAEGLSQDLSATDPTAQTSEDTGTSPANGDGAQATSPEADTQAQQSPPAGVPEKLTIDGQEVAVSDLEALYRAQAETPGIVDLGQTYANALKAFNSGPEGARQVIDAMVAAAIEQYGDKVDAGTLRGAAELNPADFTPTERILHGLVQRARSETAQVRADALKAIEGLKPRLEEVRANEMGAANAAKINATYPEAKATPEQVISWMKEHGTDDPVKAYKLANFDAKQSQAQLAPAKPKPVMPRGDSGAKTYDPKDPKLSIADRVALKQQGYVPQVAARTGT